MKTTRTFKGYWFISAVVVAIAFCELAAWKLSVIGFRINPITAAFLGLGIVTIVSSVIYDGVDIG